jgi:hypothetical protein
MANSTAPVYIKPTVAFNHGYNFVFGAWVCAADGARSFQRRLTMPPNPETGFVTLPEVVTGELASKFGEISLFDQYADFELGSASNSNSTSPWATVCEGREYGSESKRKHQVEGIIMQAKEWTRMFGRCLQPSPTRRSSTSSKTASTTVAPSKTSVAAAPSPSPTSRT